MKKYIYILLLATIWTSTSIAYEGKERVVWDKKPIQLQLKIGEERIVHFPADIEHWEPDIVKNSVVAQTVADTLYIRALTEFADVRFRVRERVSHKVYLLDVSATADANVPDVLVVISEDQLRGESDRAAETVARLSEDWRVRLTRFASQTLYAPSRVISGDASISRMPLEQGIDIPLVRGGEVKADTVASWKGGGWYVHAIRLTNKSSRQIVLDPRVSYRGRWSTVTAQHSRLGAQANLEPAGTDEAVTTVYFTSRRTLFESLNALGME